jgi:iron complex transport system substrate-binding protein
MVYALGAGDRLVGVTHECDFPPAARSKRVVRSSGLQLETMSPCEIRCGGRREASASRSVYMWMPPLRELEPDSDHHARSLRRLRAAQERYLARDR